MIEIDFFSKGLLAERATSAQKEIPGVKFQVNETEKCRGLSSFGPTVLHLLQ